MVEREVDPSNSLNDRAVAHPSTECGSNNNGEEQKTACKKVTGGSRCRQPALLTEDIDVTPGYGCTALADAQTLTRFFRSC
jgi:hypothetical protein